MPRLMPWLGLWLLGAGPALATQAGPAAAGATIHIVAAENFYGDVVGQLAGPTAQVVSVLRNPAADPHLFEIDVPTARATAGADLIIYNGLNYDPWMAKLLAGAPSSRHRVVEVASVMRRQGPNVNPHLWYDPATMPVLARALTRQLQQLDPARTFGYERRLQQFLGSLRPIDVQISRLRQLYAGTPVIATEPIADYLTGAIGLVMRAQRFQLAVMNNTEPGARETAAFEQALRSRSVRVVIYNRQTTSDALQRLLAIARESQVPVVGVTETQPPGVTYQQWMLGELAALGNALSGLHP